MELGLDKFLLSLETFEQKNVVEVYKQCRSKKFITLIILLNWHNVSHTHLLGKRNKRIFLFLTVQGFLFLMRALKPSQH